MRTVLALMNRNRKLFFKDKGMLFTSMITPVILIVLYATFLAKVFRDSFTAAIPDMITISDKLINGTVAAQLTASRWEPSPWPWAEPASTSSISVPIRLISRNNPTG